MIKIRCPNCNSENEVKETITTAMVNYRMRVCKTCKTKFYSKEDIVEPEVCESMFREYLRERSKKARAKKKGIMYEPTARGNRETAVKPKLPTSPLF